MPRCCTTLQRPWRHIGGAAAASGVALSRGLQQAANQACNSMLGILEDMNLRTAQHVAGRAVETGTDLCSCAPESSSRRARSTCAPAAGGDGGEDGSAGAAGADLGRFAAGLRLWIHRVSIEHKLLTVLIFGEADPPAGATSPGACQLGKCVATQVWKEDSQTPGWDHTAQCQQAIRVMQFGTSGRLTWSLRCDPEWTRHCACP